MIEMHFVCHPLENVYRSTDMHIRMRPDKDIQGEVVAAVLGLGVQLLPTSSG